MSESKYLVQLDGLRFLAVSGVMISHWVPIEGLSSVKSLFGGGGVNLFFTLSGFLITGILLRGKDSGKNIFFLLKQFYIRRFLRIFPLYYFILLLGVVFYIPLAREHFVWFVTYLGNYIVGWSKGNGGYYSHLWSLAVEEQFYIFFPLIIFLCPQRFYIRLIATLIVISIISRVALYLLPANQMLGVWTSYTFTPCCFDAFGIGALLAYFNLYQKDKLKVILHNNTFFILSLAVGACVTLIFHNSILDLTLFRFTFSIFSFWLIGRASFNFKGAFGSFLQNKAVIFLGKITYGLYVYHYFMPYLFTRLGFEEVWYIKILYPVVTIILASVSWYLFENPINTLKRYFEYSKSLEIKRVKHETILSIN